VDYTLKRQYIVNQITVAPDSTWIEGPVNIFYNLDFQISDICIFRIIYRKDEIAGCNFIVFTQSSKNITRTAELVALPYCTPQETAVEVDIQVEQFTEARKIIPILSFQGVIHNRPDGYLFPARLCELEYDLFRSYTL